SPPILHEETLDRQAQTSAPVEDLHQRNQGAGGTDRGKKPQEQAVAVSEYQPDIEAGHGQHEEEARYGPQTTWPQDHFLTRTHASTHGSISRKKPISSSFTFSGASFCTQWLASGSRSIRRLPTQGSSPSINGKPR